MRRVLKVLFAGALVTVTFAPAASAHTIFWECSIDGGPYETFLEVPHAALHGIQTANAATATGQAVLGETCRVVEN